MTEADAAFGKWLAKIRALGIRAPDANELFFTEMGVMLNGLYGEGYTPEEAARLLKDGRVGVIRDDGTFSNPRRH